MAPEIHQKQPYLGRSVDLFAAAIILFIMVAEHPPFNSATPSDPFYKCLAANRADIFWKSHSKNKPAGFFSESFKDLVQSMLQLEQNHRPTMSEVLAHEWLNEDTATEAEAKADMMERYQKIQQVKEEQRALNQSVDHSNTRVMRSEKDNFEATNRALDIYDDVSSKKTQFFCTKHPDHIQKRITDHLQKISIDPKISEKKYKMQYSVETTRQDGEKETTIINVRTLKVNKEGQPEDIYKGEFCTEFTMKSGNLEEFHKQFNTYRDKVITDDTPPEESKEETA